MKIVILQGSPNRRGSTYLLADSFRQGAESAGHTVEIVDAARADVRPAIADEVENFEEYDRVFIGHPIWWGTRRASFRPFSKAIRSRTKGYIPFPRAGRAAGTGRITDCGRAIRRSILRRICILPLPGSRPRRPASPTGFRKSFPQRPHKD